MKNFSKNLNISIGAVGIAVKKKFEWGLRSGKLLTKGSFGSVSKGGMVEQQSFNFMRQQIAKRMRRQKR